MSKFKIFFISLVILILPVVVLAATVNLENPLSEVNSLLGGSSYVGKVISRVLGVVGALALLMLVYGGLSIILAAGNDTKIAQGKNIVAYTAIGLVVIFMSYTAITFFLSTLGGTFQNEFQDGMQPSDYMEKCSDDCVATKFCSEQPASCILCCTPDTPLECPDTCSSTQSCTGQPEICSPLCCTIDIEI